MNALFRKSLVSAALLAGAAAVFYRPAAHAAQQFPLVLLVSDPALDLEDPVAGLFRSDRSLNFHDGPIAPDIADQLKTSPLGQAYYLVHADRSILMACGPNTKWCADPAFSFRTIFGEAALLAGSDPDVLVAQWATKSAAQDLLEQGFLPISSLADADQKLQLLAITNRMDLASQIDGKWVGAEVHFIYGATPTALFAPDFMVNLEFQLPEFPETAPPSGKDLDFPGLAANWSGLPDTTDLTYPARLKAVLQQSGFSLDKAPTRIQTLKSRINHLHPEGWRLSQLYLDPANGPAFAPRALDGQAKLEMPPLDQKSMWQGLTLLPATAGIATYDVQSAYQAETPLDYKMNSVLDTPPGVCNASEDTRNVLAMQQCSLCHTGETGTDFAHVRNRRVADQPKLSGFLVGKGLATIQPKLEDLYNGNLDVVFQVKLNYKSYTEPPKCMTQTTPREDRRFHDVARRTLFLASFLSSKGPFLIEGRPSALKFGTRFSE
jgi:hypothetical protein